MGEIAKNSNNARKNSIKSHKITEIHIKSYKITENHRKKNNELKRDGIKQGGKEMVCDVHKEPSEQVHTSRKL